MSYELIEAAIHDAVQEGGEIWEFEQDPDADDVPFEGPQMAVFLHPREKVALVATFGWHPDGGAWVKVQKHDRLTGEDLHMHVESRRGTTIVR